MFSFVVVFTDSSKIGSSVTCSITSFSKIQNLFKLPNYSLVFTAELIVIWKATIIAPKFKTSTAVCTDSSSSYCFINIKNCNQYAQVT